MSWVSSSVGQAWGCREPGARLAAHPVWGCPSLLSPHAVGASVTVCVSVRTELVSHPTSRGSWRSPSVAVLRAPHLSEHRSLLLPSSAPRRPFLPSTRPNPPALEPTSVSLPSLSHPLIHPQPWTEGFPLTPRGILSAPPSGDTSVHLAGRSHTSRVPF